MSPAEDSGQTLAGRTVVITRSRQQNVALQAALLQRGAGVVLLPSLRYRPRPGDPDVRAALTPGQGYTDVLFTSQNAARFFARVCEDLRLPKEHWRSAAIAAVGQSTEVALKESGYHVHFVSSGRTGRDLVAEMLQAGRLNSESRVLLPQSSLARPDVPDALRQAGAMVQSLIVYQTETETPESAREFLDRVKAGNVPDAILFASPSAVDGFLTLTGEIGSAFLRRPDVHIVSIGPTTSSALDRHGFQVAAEATQPGIEGLVRALEQTFG